MVIWSLQIGLTSSGRLWEDEALGRTGIHWDPEGELPQSLPHRPMHHFPPCLELRFGEKWHAGFPCAALSRLARRGGLLFFTFSPTKMQYPISHMTWIQSQR